MEWTIGKRTKVRSKVRLQVVNERKKIEAAATVTSDSKKRKRRKGRRDTYSDVEDLTPDVEDLTPDVGNDAGPSVQVSDENKNSLGSRVVSQHIQSVKESMSRIFRDLRVDKSVPSSSGLMSTQETNVDVEKSVPNSSGLGDGCEQNIGEKEKISEENWDLVVGNTVASTSSLRDGSEENISDVNEKCARELKENWSRIVRDLVVGNAVASTSGLRDGSEENISDVNEKYARELKENWSRIIRDLGIDISVPSSSGLRNEQEENTSGNEKLPVEVLDLDGCEQNIGVNEKMSDENCDGVVGNSVASSSGLRDGLGDGFEGMKEKCSSEDRGLDVEKPVPEEIEIISDSGSETEAKGSAKKKLLFDDGNRRVDSISDGGDSTSETEEDKIQDIEDVVALSSGDSSSSSLSSSSSSSDSSSSDDEINSKEVVGDTDDDSDDSRESSSPVRKVAKPGRKPLERSPVRKVAKPGRKPLERSPVRKVTKPGRKPLEKFKRPASCLTKPRQEERKKKIQKLNHRVEEPQEAEVEVVLKECNAEFTCGHCGKKNKGNRNGRSSFIRPQVTTRAGDDDDDMNQNNFDFTNEKFCEDSASINSGKSPEKPSTSRPEMVNLETGKEVKTSEKPSRPEIEDPETRKEVKRPEKLSRFEMNSPETGKEVKRPEKLSRFEMESPETSKEMKRPEKLSRYEMESPETVKELKRPVKPSTFRPDIVNSENAKEIQAPEKPSRPETSWISDKAKEVQAPEKPSRPATWISDKAKEAQTNNSSWSRIPEVVFPVGLNKPPLANPPVDDDDDSTYSISSGDKSGYESEASLKEKEEVNNNPVWRMLDGSNKEVNIVRLLVNSVWEKDCLGEEEVEELVSSPEEQSEEEEDEKQYDEDGLLITRPPPLVMNFGMEEPESPPPEMSESEKEIAKLWEEMAFCDKSEDAKNQFPPNIEKDISIDESPAARCKQGFHELCLDIEIGMKCIHCGFVAVEIRSLDPDWADKNTSVRRKNDRFEEEEEGNNNFIGKFGFEAHDKNSVNEGCVSTEGTVWDKIPGVKSEMYPHQQEGFEFIWRNLAGTIMLNELKDFEDSDETGGCIMSHAPGTGKTRLTIIFLQAYLECFPNCKPVIIAPASLLLTWAEEFKKWNISVPFHNLSSLELSGKENTMASNLLMKKNSSARSYNEIRMVKIYSWIKSKSILGISYNLYEKLAGVKDDDKKTKKAREVKPDNELLCIREILIRKPGLLVLDEAHTPRNQRSCIWKTLSKVETQKRILLSGTPFQNNFQELCNVLGLARPKYLEELTSTLKRSGMTVTKRGKRGLGNQINNRGIEELKTKMLPFVHVHKGSILQKSLPGLRECVVVLNPPELQKKVLESIEVTHNRKIKNVFETEHKLSLVSVHPSLVSRCKLTEKERLTIDEALLAQLKKVRLDPNQSVKTRFLMEFIGLCEVIKEKVLVFSQYIDPLKLIMKHLVHRFNWKPEEEVLYMHGKLEQKQRQTLINEFNDPKSKAKVMLASTKACSEGISLVGASRVILLDVVWNPAVERQAISRAYRIGQQRIVYTYHLVAKGTPEGPKYCKQAQKDRISELVFACNSKHDKGKEKIAAAVTEDKVLDTMVQHKKLGDMFDNLIVQPKEADLVDGFNILMP